MHHFKQVNQQRNWQIIIAPYDDAQGVGVSIGIAKALVDSGFTPDKAIRFCFHGAEEWGREGSEYDWSSGAYEEIMTNHPE